ncbi:hypothetical protein J4E90_003977 [Alternaria incomplexa]|uniref:uncharacterized protein n=1 Tax=Alternaria incomplexa TaxID=1187928 RepID=UPI00221F0144|nr:uncharacterized protein J4E90_003977 [Alternaria incomplexa]KAI4915532.1 hypothetical protein J4E90_003977 [Alternaria incomplexa]
MPAQTTCPIPEVDRALSSYINSREDTLRIRRALSKYLTSSLRPVNAATQNQHLNHECPQNLSAANTNPPGLKDTRLEYLQALRANSQAQARHRELQTSLEDLRNRYVDENPTQPESEYDNEVTRGYVALLRQRRRYAELQVIQESLDKLLTAKPSTAAADPRASIRNAIGEQPDLPAERLEQLSQAEDDQDWVFRLKQEVLEARTAMERAQAARQKAQDEMPGEPSLQAQVHALERARDELVDWVQGELAKMEEDSVFLEDASPVKRPVSVTAPVDLASAETQIRESYNKYIEARASLLEAHASLQQPLDVQTDDQNGGQTTPNEDGKAAATKPIRPITKLLPYLPHLTQIANNERSLLQQSVYLQSQIASADQNIEEALLRLSGESHLLPAGSKEVAAWGKTARESEAATEKLVKERLQAARQEVGSVSTIVELCSLQSKVLESA